jgi:small-conductance mechanosensitive channel
LDTPAVKIEKAAAIIRNALADHEGMDPKYPPRVHFAEINPTAFKIQFYFWYTPVDFWKFRDFSEKVNLLIFHEFEREGIQFSLPFRHTYWKFDDEQGPVDVRILHSGADSGTS